MVSVILLDSSIAIQFLVSETSYYRDRGFFWGTLDSDQQSVQIFYKEFGS